MFPKEINLYVFLQSIYYSLGFSLNFETTSQFQPNLEHSRHLKDIIFLRLCRNWELSRTERFKLELSETEAKALGITGSAWQQLDVPGSHRPNLSVFLHQPQPAQSSPACPRNGREHGACGQGRILGAKVMVQVELVELFLVQLCLFYL